MLNKQAKNRLYEYFITKLGVRPYKRGWLKGNCPFCGKNDKFGVNLWLNRTNCFVCGDHKTPIDLVVDLENLSNRQEGWKYLRIYEGKEYLDPIVERIERVDMVLPEGYVNLLLGDSRVAKTARSYVKGRGFDVEEVALKGWGYCTRGEYLGYIILPFYTGGKLIYFNARKYMGIGTKYKNPSIDDTGIGKSLILYNADALLIYKRIYLAEGLLNADTLGEDCIASGGKKISDNQLSMIMKSPVKEVVIILDPDALDDAIKIGLKLVNHKKVKIVQLPTDKDINDIGKQATLELVNKSKWLSYNDILKLKCSL